MRWKSIYITAFKFDGKRRWSWGMDLNLYPQNRWNSAIWCRTSPLLLFESFNKRKSIGKMCRLSDRNRLNLFICARIWSMGERWGISHTNWLSLVKEGIESCLPQQHHCLSFPYCSSISRCLMISLILYPAPRQLLTVGMTTVSINQ